MVEKTHTTITNDTNKFATEQLLNIPWWKWTTLQQTQDKHYLQHKCYSTIQPFIIEVAYFKIQKIQGGMIET